MLSQFRPDEKLIYLRVERDVIHGKLVSRTQEQINLVETLSLLHDLEVSWRRSIEAYLHRHS
jgi:hypothetical protein